MKSFFLFGKEIAKMKIKWDSNKIVKQDSSSDYELGQQSRPGP
jgi:hypothetical protein